MRQPLEDREVTISEQRFSVNYPASFMLVAKYESITKWLFPDDPMPTLRLNLKCNAT